MILVPTDDGGVPAFDITAREALVIPDRDGDPLSLAVLSSGGLALLAQNTQDRPGLPDRALLVFTPAQTAILRAVLNAILP